MNLTLTRKSFELYGVFGELSDEDGNVVAVTLEHSFSNSPKLPVGTYECVRGEHKLHNLNPFTTFEITEVPGHTGILFHKGNWNNDSEGCVLLGSRIGIGCILESSAAFNKFMELQQGVDSFLLVVI